MIPAGSLQDRIILQRPIETQAASGVTTVAWTDVAEVWAEVKPLSGREALAAQQLTATVSHRIRIRYRTDVSPKWRVLLGARIFLLDSVLEMERRVGLDLMATEFVEVAA